VPLIIRIVDIVEKPIVGMAYQLTLEDAQFSGNTSPDGLIAHKVDPDAKFGTLTLDGFEREVTIVPMEDSTAVAGAQARLSNLACGTDDAQEGILDDATQLALQRFQQRHGLTTSGQLDAATSAKLKDSYGS
jgi:murein L,D-transpeptidase YcbB/YkuD